MEFQKEESAEILNIFQRESLEIISSADNGLLTLEKDPKNKQAAINLFRDIHSLKGSARMLGFEDIQNIAHKIEDIISLVREEKLVINNQISDIISKCLNYTIELINKTVELKKEYKSPETKKYIELLNNINVINDTQTNNNSDEILLKLPLMETSLAFFDEGINLIDTRINNEKNQEIKDIFICIKDMVMVFKNKSVPITHDISLAIQEAIEGLKQDKCNIDEIKTKINVIKTMLDFQSKEIRSKKTLPSNGNFNQKEFLNDITNSQINTLRIDSSKLDNLDSQIRELIISKIKTNEQLKLIKKINEDLEEWQRSFSKMEYYIKYFEKKYLSNPYETINWDFRTLSGYNKQLFSLASSHYDKITTITRQTHSLFSQIQESETKLNSTTNEIENMVKNMRVLPFSTIFQLFPRMIHNIAYEKNKKIDVEIEGKEVSADKTIIEEIKIPLMHIIRNSIDHGIEDVNTRVAIGKNPIGKIKISAFYRDDKVVIDVKDDGRGLDIEKIKAKALEMKLLTPNELDSIEDEELTNLIFYPGFSTENFVTELSGRGLGLDIVNNKINQMQGRIDVFSQLNKGTHVRITLPSTIARKRVFIIKEQEQLYAIDTSVIKSIIRIETKDIHEKDGSNYCIHDGKMVSIYSLSQIFNFKNTARQSDKYTLLIVETNDFTFGIIVEKLISDQEIVHKKLEPPLYHVPNILGITTLANGETCLILNVTDILSTINSAKIGTKVIPKHGIIKTKDNSQYNILLVDDSKVIRILQKNILKNNGYKVKTAQNTEIALDLMAQKKYDLIITDINMPNTNGFDFVAQLRKIPEYRDCPVIVLSSDNKELHRADIKRVRISAYIQKSKFNQTEYIKLIEELL